MRLRLNPTDLIGFLEPASDGVQDLGAETVDGVQAEHYRGTYVPVMELPADQVLGSDEYVRLVEQASKTQPGCEENRSSDASTTNSDQNAGRIAFGCSVVAVTGSDSGSGN